MRTQFLAEEEVEEVEEGVWKVFWSVVDEGWRVEERNVGGKKKRIDEKRRDDFEKNWISHI